MGKAKNLLFDVRNEQKEIIILRGQIEEAELALLPSAIRYDRDKVQTSPDDPMIRMMEKVEKYQELLRLHLESIYEKRQLAIRIIRRLDDTAERQILELYFLSASRPTLSQVGEVVGYSRAQTYRIYRRALDKIKRW